MFFLRGQCSLDRREKESGTLDVHAAWVSRIVRTSGVDTGVQMDRLTDSSNKHRLNIERPA